MNEYTFVVGNGIGSTIGSVNRMILRAHEQISNKQYVGSVRFEYIDDADINGYSPVNGYSAYSWVEKASLTDEEILGGMTGGPGPEGDFTGLDGCESAVQVSSEFHRR